MIEVRAGKNSNLFVVEEKDGGIGGFEGKYTNIANSNTADMIAPEDEDSCLSSYYA